MKYEKSTKPKLLLYQVSIVFPHFFFLYWKQFFFSIFLCGGLLKKYYDFPIVLKSPISPSTLGNLKISTFATNKSKISKHLSHSPRMKSGMNGWNMFNDGDFFTAVAIIVVVVVLVCW